jgi:parallel beta-helix repeat protein
MMPKSYLLIAAFAFLFSGRVGAATLTVERGSDLQAVIDYTNDGDTLILAAKTFEAKPTLFTEPLCGNCQDPKTEVQASYGFIVKGKSLVIIGRDRSASRLITNAGYGLYFEGSPDSKVLNVTVTGGRRDPDGNATDAGIVVRRSCVHMENVDIRDNDHRIDTVVVGIGGIFGREGAEIVVKNCNIVNNGWDGVALYRGASATITDCLIKDGRGAGIGVTWDASCVAYRNEVTGYWKGIGAFGTTWVMARNNLVHDNLGWGIIATGQSYMDITNNVVHHNGNCGVAPWSTESRGRIVNNIISENGWRDQWVCPCVGVWNYGDWAKWRFAHNIVWGNKAGEYEDIWDQTGFNGNLNEDPKFVGDGDFRLRPDSPAYHAGDTLIYNPDGSTSHIGLYGGPQAKPDRP